MDLTLKKCYFLGSVIGCIKQKSQEDGGLNGIESFFSLMLKIKFSSYKQRIELWLQRVGAGGKWGDIGQKVQSFSYKMNKFWRCYVQQCNYS